MRLIFMGTPQFAVPSLAQIIGAGHEVAAVYTQPPRPAGRKLEPRKTPVHEFAERVGLKVRTPSSLKDTGEQRALSDLGAEAAVVVAYGLILPQAVLDAVPRGCFNLHASLLPRWRGAAPINRAIMAGDTVTGVMVMRMEAGLDTGAVCMSERLAIGDNMTAGELHDQLCERGADLLVRALGALSRDALNCVAQADEGVTYAGKIDKAETRIDWSRPAAQVHNHIRGLSPFPGAWCEMQIAGKPQRVKVLLGEVAEGEGKPGELLDARLTVACGSGAVRLLRLQRAGGQPVAAEDFLRGAAQPPGTLVS